jgi:hypothetical protein
MGHGRCRFGSIRYYAAMLAVFVLLGVAMVSLMLWGRGELNRFLRDHTAIAGEAEFETFKALARRNMIAALTMLGLAFAWVPLGLYLMFSKQPGATIAFAIAGGLLGFIGRKGRALEAAARSLPCDERLRSEYESVGRHWVTKALPNF